MRRDEAAFPPSPLLFMFSHLTKPISWLLGTKILLFFFFFKAFLMISQWETEQSQVPVPTVPIKLKRKMIPSASLCLTTTCTVSQGVNLGWLILKASQSSGLWHRIWKIGLVKLRKAFKKRSLKKMFWSLNHSPRWKMESWRDWVHVLV